MKHKWFWLWVVYMAWSMVGFAATRPLIEWWELTRINIVLFILWIWSYMYALNKVFNSK